MPEQKWTQTDWDTCLSTSVNRALETVGLFLVGETMLNLRQNRSIRTGRLAGSITYATEKKKSAVSSPASVNDAVDSPGNAWTLHVGTAVEYAPYVEYPGKTRNYPGKPYLRPALDNNRKTIQEIFAKALQGGIRRHGK